MGKCFFDNTIMNKLRNKEKVCASWAQLGSNISSEILAEAGFDVIVIDMEHSQTSLPGVVSMIQGTKGTGCAPFVRAPWNDLVWCKQILDCGAYGIHIPYVSNREEAITAVKSCKYALEGYRGLATSQRAVNYGMNKEEYFERANRDIIIMVAIETREGVDKIEEIASVEGVDGIFIGPSDLATSLGYIGNPKNDEVQEAIRKVEAAVLKTDKFLGTIAPDFEAAKALYDRGYSIVYFMSDAGAVMKTASANVKAFRELYG